MLLSVTGTCTKTASTDWDTYTSKPRVYPTKALGVCTHNQVYSASQDKRQLCS